ncbi:YccF domain-containing protein [Tomitella cavernea]|uniref:YccF domain-containing protein n=1 Tax=Tomitella cavernea TaxID=1387982 RepID=A0ABP9D3C3_9ACTN|nr:YccF domain-containing protein [Tomitella cavernea]
MNLVLNVIWLVFGGLWLALGYFAIGIVLCILIITIPFGIAAFRMGVFALWPFGRTVVDKPEAGSTSLVMNVIWFVIAGLWMALGHIATAFVQAITIIGIPLALANIKMIPVTCFPFGKDIVSTDRPPAGAHVYYQQN